jgi:precorrin-6B methylase 1
VFYLTKIGVEQSLTNVQEALREKGYEIVELKQESDANGCSCCVITGGDSNFMGVQNAITKGSVIDASGLTADEVCQQVEARIQ